MALYLASRAGAANLNRLLLVVILGLAVLGLISPSAMRIAADWRASFKGEQDSTDCQLIVTGSICTAIEGARGEQGDGVGHPPPTRRSSLLWAQTLVNTSSSRLPP